MSPVDEPVAVAAAAILRGEVVACPTETYYAFAVDALNPDALERLFVLKGRQESKASALLVADIAMFAGLCLTMPGQARALAASHWPGPLTLALPAREGLPAAIVSDGCVAARVSSHPLAQALVRAAGRPLTATSANPSGVPPVRRTQDLLTLFPTSGFHILDGGTTPGGAASTLVRIRDGQMQILRQGAVTP